MTEKAWELIEDETREILSKTKSILKLIRANELGILKGIAPLSLQEIRTINYDFKLVEDNNSEPFLGPLETS